MVTLRGARTARWMARGPGRTGPSLPCADLTPREALEHAQALRAADLLLAWATTGAPQRRDSTFILRSAASGVRGIQRPSHPAAVEACVSPASLDGHTQVVGRPTRCMASR